MLRDQEAFDSIALGPAAVVEAGELAQPTPMARFDVRSTEIPVVKLITPVRHRDRRGFFSETYNRRALAEAGIKAKFIQDNLSLSSRAGTLRGLHFQAPPHAQTKLVWMLQGAAIDEDLDPVRRVELDHDVAAESGRAVAQVHRHGHNWPGSWIWRRMSFSCTASMPTGGLWSGVGCAVLK